MYKAVRSTNVPKNRTRYIGRDEWPESNNPIIWEHAKLKIDNILGAHLRCVSLVLAICADLQFSELWDGNDGDAVKEKTETDPDD